MHFPLTTPAKASTKAFSNQFSVNILRESFSNVIFVLASLGSHLNGGPGPHKNDDSAETFQRNGVLYETGSTCLLPTIEHCPSNQQTITH